MTLPEFRYHPDPIASGSIVVSSAMCRCCGQSRGYIYDGPVYAGEELTDALCPWCIADGSAHAKFDAAFTDSEAFAVGTPASAVQEIAERTP
ncbi:MAG: CbrC family protein, partial [Gemmatimonadaceae bacterium]